MEVTQSRQSLALLALGFRPFFLVAGLAACLLMALWLAIWNGYLAAPPYYGALNWHIHEMLFGYTAAVIAGFLLTAVRNWSGIATASGTALAGLVLLWLAARLLPLFPVIPAELITLADISFLPLLIASLAKPVFAASNKHNRMILMLLLLMAFANGLMHAQLLGHTQQTFENGEHLMLGGVLLLIIMIAGRVMPFFTEAALPGTRCSRYAIIEKLNVYTLLALVVTDTVGWYLAAGVIALALAGIQVIRIKGWYQSGVFGIPILRVLYIAYLWLILGLLLRGFSGFDLVSESIAIHIYTIGTIGLLTLGMMARVALGHTGRTMQSTASINIAFTLLSLTVIARTLMVMFFPENHNLWINLSGLLWISAFILFLVHYTPILIKARIDGKPG